MDRLQRLDIVLKILEDLKGHLMREKYPTEDFFGELQSILKKLSKDGYIEILPDALGNKEPVYRIIYEGRVFNQLEGYEKKWKEVRRVSWPQRNWPIVALITFIIGLLSPIVVEYCKRKILPESNQSGKTTQGGTDTLQSGRKNYNLDVFDSAVKAYNDSIKQP